MLGVVKADLAASGESDGMSCRGEPNPCHAERNDLLRFAKQIMESKHPYPHLQERWGGLSESELKAQQASPLTACNLLTKKYLTYKSLFIKDMTINFR
jgi:hypothetical protein